MYKWNRNALAPISLVRWFHFQWNRNWAYKIIPLEVECFPLTRVVLRAVVDKFYGYILCYSFGLLLFLTLSVFLVAGCPMVQVIMCIDVNISKQQSWVQVSKSLPPWAPGFQQVSFTSMIECTECQACDCCLFLWWFQVEFPQPID